MTEIAIQKVDVPDRVPVGRTFAVSGAIDNKENVAPLLGGNCRNGTRQGEVVVVKMKVLDDDRNEVTSASEELCAGYGFDAQDANFSFDVYVDTPGEYQIKLEATTKRKKGSGNHAESGPHVVNIIGEGDSGGGGDTTPDGPAISFQSAQVTSPKSVTKRGSVTIRSEAVVKNNTHTPQSVRVVMALNGRRVKTGNATIPALDTKKVVIKTNISKSTAIALLNDGDNNSVTVSIDGMEKDAGGFYVNFPKKKKKGGDKGDKNKDKKKKGSVISWANDNPLKAGGIAILGTWGAKRYTDEKKAMR